MNSLVSAQWTGLGAWSTAAVRALPVQTFPWGGRRSAHVSPQCVIAYGTGVMESRQHIQHGLPHAPLSRPPPRGRPPGQGFQAAISSGAQGFGQ